MDPVPPKLRRQLDADYGKDGWTYVGHVQWPYVRREDEYIDIRFYLTGAVISFNMWHYM